MNNPLRIFQTLDRHLALFCPATLDRILTKMARGDGKRLEHSQVLVFCMSAIAFGSDWAQSPMPNSQPPTLNPQPTGAPLNQECRFIPLRLEDCDCPNGAVAFSPRLARRAYLGFPATIRHNPNGVAASAWRFTEPQPRWGCGFSARRFPRVARAAQPWALRRSSVGAITNVVV